MRQRMVLKLSAATVGLAVVGVGIALSAPADFQPALNDPPPRPAASVELPAAVPPDAGGNLVSASPTNLSPTASRVGRSASAVLPGPPVQVVEARRGHSSYDLAVARRSDGGGYEVSVFYKFAPYELADAGLETFQAPNGHGWVGAEGPDLRSIYYLSKTGVALRLAQYSASATDQVAQISLVMLAERLVTEVSRGEGPPAATIITRSSPGGQP